VPRQRQEGAGAWSDCQRCNGSARGESNGGDGALPSTRATAVTCRTSAETPRRAGMARGPNRYNAFLTPYGRWRSPAVESWSAIVQRSRRPVRYQDLEVWTHRPRFLISSVDGLVIDVLHLVDRAGRRAPCLGPGQTGRIGGAVRRPGWTCCRRTSCGPSVRTGSITPTHDDLVQVVAGPSGLRADRCVPGGPTHAVQFAVPLSSRRIVVVLPVGPAWRRIGVCGRSEVDHDCPDPAVAHLRPSDQRVGPVLPGL
jgi:hypothetical protein